VVSIKLIIFDSTFSTYDLPLTTELGGIMKNAHLIISIVLLMTLMLLPCCASKQVSRTSQLGRYLEVNPEKVWNATLEALNIRDIQVVISDQEDPTGWVIETAMKRMKVREMRNYAVSQYGYKPNLVTYMSGRYKLKIIIEPISATSCSMAIKFHPQLLAGGTSDYAGDWEDAQSNGTYENELVQTIQNLIGPVQNE
jgi:hypothetical protein